MNPFLTIPIALPGDDQKGNKDKTVDCKLLPQSVLAYHEGYDWGIIIYLQTGQAFMSTLTMDQFEMYLKEYWKEVAANLNGKAKPGRNIVYPLK
ncbi:MAG: hypothetical protein Q8941_20485 [Bacteroidota bacterium]|nr:hypothetical protein [Bacteroidota bacterium]